MGTLTIAGDGPDKERLAARFDAIGVHPSWLGTVPPHQVADVYARHSIFLFPSHFEGMSLALAEAMASGLAPVAARIRGVTDVIIEDGVSGFLFEQGDLRKARDCLHSLLRDQNLLTNMRMGAAKRARALCDLSAMTDAYVELFHDIVARPYAVRSLPLTRWAVPYRMQPGLRSLIPPGIRRRIGNLILRHS